MHSKIMENLEWQMELFQHLTNLSTEKDFFQQTPKFSFKVNESTLEFEAFKVKDNKKFFTK